MFILYANGQEQDARSVLSDMANQMRVAERTLAREEPRIAEARESLPALEAEVAGAEEGSFALRSAERRLERAQETIETGERRLVEARAAIEEFGPQRDAAAEARQGWSNWAGRAFYLILALLAIDAVLLPFMVRKANANLPDERKTEAELALEAIEARKAPSTTANMPRTGSTGCRCSAASSSPTGR